MVQISAKMPISLLIVTSTDRYASILGISALINLWIQWSKTNKLLQIWMQDWLGIGLSTDQTSPARLPKTQVAMLITALSPALLRHRESWGKRLRLMGQIAMLIAVMCLRLIIFLKSLFPPGLKFLLMECIVAYFQKI